MDAINRVVVAYLLNSFWQIMVIAAFALTCSVCLRRSPGRYRHILWVVCLGACALVPVVSIVVQLGGEAKAGAQVAGAGSAEVAASHQGGWAFSRLRGRTRPVQFAPVLVRMAALTYLALLLVRLLGLGWMYWRTWRIRSIAHEKTIPAGIAHAVERCRQLFGLAAVPVLCSEEITTPSTLGWRKPVLLIPASFFTDEIREEDAIAALSHEMAHIRRHDFLLNLWYEVVSLPLWIHPGTALIKARIAQTREEACDEMAARLLPSGKQYARSLVHIAQTLSGIPWPRSNYAMGLFDTHTLEERIMNIVRMHEYTGKRSRTRMLVSLAVVTVVSILTCAFSLRVAADTAATDTQRFVGTWVTKYKGQAFITLKLRAENGRLTGSCIHVDRLDNVSGELIPSSDQFTEQEIIQAQVSGNKLELRIGDHDSISFEFTLKGTNEGEMRVIGDVPDAPPQKKPWHFERVVSAR